jgi:hypothetical protein
MKVELVLSRKKKWFSGSSSEKHGEESDIY